MSRGLNSCAIPPKTKSGTNLFFFSFLFFSVSFFPSCFHLRFFLFILLVSFFVIFFIYLIFYLFIPHIDVCIVFAMSSVVLEISFITHFLLLIDVIVYAFIIVDENGRI